MLRMCNNKHQQSDSNIFIHPKYDKKIDKQKQQRSRQTFYKAKYRRKMYLHRFGMMMGDNRKKLWFCNNHPVEKIIDQYRWIDTRGKSQNGVSIIVLPVDANAPPNRTRSQQETRQPAAIKNNRQPRTINNKSKTANVNRQYCCFVNCTSSRCTAFTRIPPPLSLLKIPTNNTNSNLLRYAINKDFRQESRRRVGIKNNDNRANMRICNQHTIEKIQRHVPWTDKHGNEKTKEVTMYLPTTDGVAFTSMSQQENRGLGFDRFINRQIQSLRENNEHDKIMAMQLLESQEGNMEQINPLVAKNVGIERTSDDNNKKIWVIMPQYIKDNKQEPVRTVVRLDELTDDIIKTTTGFTSIASMLAFIIVINNGNIQQIEQTTTHLTWLEEWLAYFETIWGKHSNRWVDLEIRYKSPSKSLRTVFDNKLTIHIRCVLACWPRFASHDEDITLRKDKWNEHYGSRRLIMWDNTNIPLTYKPSSSDAQRNTYSMYYAGNVAKGAVFIQPCGWIGTYELWVGAVSDTDYMERSGVLTYQKNFVELCDPSDNTTAFTILLDKGYRITTAAWRIGTQFVLQPTFARSDRKFTSVQTIRSAAVAADRAANERAVRYSKLSSYIRSGLRQNEDANRISDVWIVWSFQCNFVYRPVL